MENKIYNLSEYRNIKLESQSQSAYEELEEQYPEQQPIHRIILFGHKYRIKPEAWDMYEAIGEGLTMLFGVGSILIILFFFLFLAQR